MAIEKRNNLLSDRWSGLRAFTQARIALGRTGVAIPLKETLAFRLAHAHARDAVYSSLDLPHLQGGISNLGLDCMLLKSEVRNRDEYLKRPDKGRQLSADSSAKLLQLELHPSDIAIVVSDGLSATAVNENFLPLLEKMKDLNIQLKYSWAPIVLVEQGRGAVADEIAALLRSQLVIHFIGERPGLSSSNSLGAYITFNPVKGMTDESRNCISNIRPEGLPIEIAAEKVMYMAQQALSLRLSGVQLKDTFPGHLLLK